MMCLNVSRCERHLLAIISKAILSGNHLTVSCVHANHTLKTNNGENNGKENQLSVKNTKLDTFVDRIRLRSTRYTKLHHNPPTEQRSVKHTNVRENTSLIQPYVAENKRESIQDVSFHKRKQSLSIEEKDFEESITQLMDSEEVVEVLSKIEAFLRQNRQVPFRILRRLCGRACTAGLVDEVLKIKKLAKESHPHIYKKELCLDNYLASALCYSEDFKGSLDKLLSLYRKQPRFKKTKDTAAHIIFHIMRINDEGYEQMVLKFVKDVAEQNVLNPALALWRVGFCSTLYRQQKIADSLLENYPGLVEMLPQKLDNIIKLAYGEADVDLLHRIFGLLLRYQLTDYYSAATAALLQLQCEIGDMAGADETIKFAHMLRIQLKPSQIQRFLALLHHDNHPAPLSLLEMKYRLPSKPSTHRPPEFQYKF